MGGTSTQDQRQTQTQAERQQSESTPWAERTDILLQPATVSKGGRGAAAAPSNVVYGIDFRGNKGRAPDDPEAA